MNLHHKLIPARFLSLVSHFIAVLLVFSTKSANLRASLPVGDTSNWDKKDRELQAALVLSLLCIIAEFLGLFMGISLFLARFNSFSLMAHFSGSLLICWFIIDTWATDTIWYIWVFFTLLPAIGELVAFLRVFCCRVVQY